MVTLIRLDPAATEYHHRQVVERLRFAGIPVRDHRRHLLSVPGNGTGAAELLSAEPLVEEVVDIPSDNPCTDRAARPGSRTTVRVGNTVVGGPGFTVMAGPCSVESREQLMSIAGSVRAAGAHILRGGLFKPRTSPYGFQGLGRSGTAITDEARATTGLPLVTEVVDVRDIEAVAAHAEMIQVGARNMYNYALLRELGRTNIPVLLKRGLAATVDEYLLAAEYLLAGGNDRVVLCERGIRTFEHGYRFTLDITAVPLLRERTHLPVIVDPSHAAGATRWVEPLALSAAAVGADGIIVETHCDPATALCDGKQALPTGALDGLMNRLGVAVAAAGRELLPPPQAIGSGNRRAG